MLFNFSLTLFLLLQLFSIPINSQTTDDDLTVFHPFTRVFRPSELRLLRESDFVSITPLDFERRETMAWKMGRRDAMRQLSRNLTLADGGVDVDAILDKNKENELFLTPEQVQHQILIAYQLGSLHAINRVVRPTGRRLPAIRRVSRDEMRRRFRQMMRMWRMGGSRIVKGMGIEDPEKPADPITTELNPKSHIEHLHSTADEESSEGSESLTEVLPSAAADSESSESDSGMETNQIGFGGPFGGWGWGGGFGPWGGYGPWGGFGGFGWGPGWGWGRRWGHRFGKGFW